MTRITPRSLTFLSLATACLTTAASAELVVHWTLDETSGTTAADSAGTAQNGTLLNASGGTPNWTTGFLGGAYEFTASADEVISTTVPINNAPVGSWGNWVRMAETDNSGAMTGFASSTLFDQYMSTRVSSSAENNGKPFVQKRNPTATTTGPVSSVVVEDDTWHHVMTTIDWVDANNNGSVEADEQTRRIYVDGILTGTRAEDLSRIALSVLSAGAIDRPTDVISEFDGLIDDVGYWDNALDGVDIALIHGLGRFSEVTLSDGSIADVRAAWEAGAGNSALSGSETWFFTDGLSGPTGAIGGSVAGNDAFIVLDGSAGTGVTLIPEPASLALLGLGGLCLFGRRARSA